MAKCAAAAVPDFKRFDLYQCRTQKQGVAAVVELFGTQVAAPVCLAISLMYTHTHTRQSTAETQKRILKRISPPPPAAAM